MHGLDKQWRRTGLWFVAVILSATLMTTFLLLARIQPQKEHTSTELVRSAFLMKLEDNGYVSGNEKGLSATERKAISFAKRYQSGVDSLFVRYRVIATEQGFHVHVVTFLRGRAYPTFFGIDISNDWKTTELWITA